MARTIISAKEAKVLTKKSLPKGDMVYNEISELIQRNATGGGYVAGYEFEEAESEVLIAQVLRDLKYQGYAVYRNERSNIIQISWS